MMGAFNLPFRLETDGSTSFAGGAQFAGEVSATGDSGDQAAWRGTYQDLAAVDLAIPARPFVLGDFVALRVGGFASYCGEPPSWQPVIASTLAPI